MRIGYVVSGKSVVPEGKHELTSEQMYRLTIRATDEAVPPVLLKYMVETLEQGVDSRHEDVPPMGMGMGQEE